MDTADGLANELRELLEEFATLSSRPSRIIDSPAKRAANVTPGPDPVTSAPVISERVTVRVQATASHSHLAQVPVQSRKSNPPTPTAVDTSLKSEQKQQEKPTGNGLKVFLGLAVGTAIFVTIAMLNSMQRGVTATPDSGIPAASIALPAVIVPRRSPLVDVPRGTPSRPNASGAARHDDIPSRVTTTATTARRDGGVSASASDLSRSPISTAAAVGESDPLFTFTKMLDTGTQLLNAGVPGLAYLQFQRTLNAVTSRIREQPGALALDTLRVRTERLLKVARQQCADSSDRKLVRAGCS